jgi:hypothetical protein
MKLFRILSNEEEEAFREWARKHYVPFTPIDGCWHPVLQSECAQMNVEAKLPYDRPDQTRAS